MQSPDKKFSIGILGAKGLFGSDLAKFLKRKFRVVSITKENYNQQRGKNFDVLVNANGNSKRFWANENPLEDFLVSTLSVYKSISDFPCELYIYISSPDVYSDHEDPKSSKETTIIKPASLEPYGFNKYLSELIVKKYSKKYLIIRSAMILGKKLKKGPFYDLLKGNPLYVNLQTKLQLITTREISEVLMHLLKKNISNEVVNVGGRGTFELKRIKKYFNGKFQIEKSAKKQVYEMNISKLKKIFPGLKTSEEYLQDFLN